jgi:hypothetical protein
MSAGCTFENDEIDKCAIQDYNAYLRCRHTPGMAGYCYRDPSDRKIYRQAVNSAKGVLSGSRHVCKAVEFKPKTGKARCQVTLRDCPFWKGRVPTSFKAASVKVWQNGHADPSDLNDLFFGSTAIPLPSEWSKVVPATRLSRPEMAVVAHAYSFDDAASCRKLELDAEGSDKRDAQGELIWASAPELTAEQCCTTGKEPVGGYRYETRKEFWESFCTLNLSTIKKGTTTKPQQVTTIVTKPTAVKVRKGIVAPGVQVEFLK